MRIVLFLAALFPGIAHAETVDRRPEHQFVKELMYGLQWRSFEENRELCGYIGYDRAGRLRTSEIAYGTEASCAPPEFPRKLRVVAWFHTHSTYSPEYQSEYPSIQDLDFGEYRQLNGYTATPGGRLWYHDVEADEIMQLCELECVPQDPNFREAPGDPARRVYTRRMLEKVGTY